MTSLDQVAVVTAEQLLALREEAFRLLPRALTALVLSLFGLLLGFLARLVVRRLVGVLDRLLPGARLRHSLRRLGLERPAGEILGTIFFWLILLIVLSAAFDSLGFPVLSAWLTGVVRYLPSVLAALVIVLVGLVAGVLLRDAVSSAATSAGLTYATLIGRALQVSVVGISILVAVDQVGLNVSLVANLLAALVGASLFGGTLAFGLGARVTVANILAGHYVRRIYSVGQRVRIGDVQGEIDQITPTAVILAEDSGDRCVIPAKLFSEEVTHLVTG